MDVSEHLLEIADVHVYYGRSHVLHGVDLAVGIDEPVSLIGRNGMGKTTLCSAIMGLVPIEAGRIAFDGTDLAGRKPHHIAALGIGYVPQGRRIFPSLSVQEHLKLVSGRNAGRWDIDFVYDLFPPLAVRRSARAGSLSGGEQQMLAIARAMLLNPRLLLMDEPSEGLAPVVVAQLEEVLRDLASEDIGLLLVEQNLAVATTVSTQVAVMVGGRVALETTSEQMLADEETQRRYLGVGFDRHSKKEA